MSAHRIIKVTSLIAGFLILVVFFSIVGVYFWTQNIIKTQVAIQANYTNSGLGDDLIIETIKKFPVGVDPIAETITENPEVDDFVQTFLNIDTLASRENRYFDRLLSYIIKWDWYQNLASSISRILVVYPGERHEEVIDNFGDILRWTEAERNLFYVYISGAEPKLLEGKFFPGRYIVSYDSTPEQVADLMYERFESEILDRFDQSANQKVSPEDTINIASLLEREAYDFVDMRYISGIIWNRLFIDMPLQLDATLQYVRGNDTYKSQWWPKVVPKDKFIESPYNTYENKGLPPGAISNPSPEAIVAALNPRKTDCMFYFHDRKGKFYCTENYKDHVTKLKEVYGQGR